MSKTKQKPAEAPVVETPVAADVAAVEQPIVEVVEDAPVVATEPTTTPPAPAEVPELTDFLRQAEAARIADDVVLVSASHPNATDGQVWQGIYSGVRLSRGEMSATYSDGMTT